MPLYGKNGKGKYNKSAILPLYIIMKKHKLTFLGTIATLLLTMFACTDDDSFSTSAGLRLTFSEDTIFLDTVFSRVPTAAKSFWVFNHSGDGIRCSQVKLEKGNQTGFRVNVDGTYLSSTLGYQTQNVEIRNKDSIRVFVELTSPENGIEGPQLLEDNIVFTMESGVEQKVNLNAYTWDAEILSNLVIKGDTTLGGEKPTVIYGGIRVDSLATLHIPAGKTLYFHAGAGIDVYGRLLVEGTAEQNVILRGDRLDHMFDYLPYDLVSGQWNGIHFFESSYDNRLEYMDLHSTFHGIVCDSSDISRTKLELWNSTVHNCQGAALQEVSSMVNVYNTLLSNTLGPCADISGGNVVLQHCTMAQFYPFDAMRAPALQFHNGPGQPMQLACVNSLVTGYAEDVIMGSQNDTTEVFDYRFIGSILRTPKVETADSVRFESVIWENTEDTLGTGDNHFRLVDISTQHYDFHLDSLSTAIGKAHKDYALPTDRDGKPRGDSPDIGCYQYVALPAEQEPTPPASE